MRERINEINDMEMPRLLRNMRLINIVLSILQIIAGIMGLFSFVTLDIAGSLVSIYVIIFALVLFLFECRLKRMEAKIRQNFGFLYSFKGRAGFIFFIGFLDFGIDSALGTVAGILMCLNALFNIIVMCRHPEFRTGNLTSSTDPTQNYSTGNQEAAKYMSQNPNLAAQAFKMAATSGK